MNIRVFTLPFNPVLGGFDDAEVRAFTADKQVKKIKDHAFVHNGVPHLSLVVIYYPPDGKISMPMETNRAKSDDAWRKLLTPETTPLFNSLREWRAERSKAEGVPPYFICTNKQLVDIVINKPNSLVQLGKIEGVGPGKLEKYGKEILAVLGAKPDTKLEPKMKDAGAEKKDEKQSKE